MGHITIIGFDVFRVGERIVIQQNLKLEDSRGIIKYSDILTDTPYTVYDVLYEDYPTLYFNIFCDGDTKEETEDNIRYIVEKYIKNERFWSIKREQQELIYLGFAENDKMVARDANIPDISKHHYERFIRDDYTLPIRNRTDKLKEYWDSFSSGLVVAECVFSAPENFDYFLPLLELGFVSDGGIIEDLANNIYPHHMQLSECQIDTDIEEHDKDESRVRNEYDKVKHLRKWHTDYLFNYKNPLEEFEIIELAGGGNILSFSSSASDGFGKLITRH